MPEAKDQIKERIGVVELVGEYLKLDRAGSNFKALCPFHNEKTPSFMVNPERNFWYCFGCQKGGDVFSFVMEMEGVDFRTALERLAQRAGVELPSYAPVDREKSDAKKRILEVLEQATSYYQSRMKEDPRGQQALQYLSQRKIKPEQIRDFRIGYAPQGWSNALEYLKNKGFRENEIDAAGLLVRKESSVGYYDRFRDRIMFPVIDISGSVVGYSARVMPGSDESSAKYINTPQTQVYDKSSVLYGLYQSRTEIKKKNSVIIVEGNVDVIASHSAGVGNVVAVSGTALSLDQVRILRRYGQEFKLCFDMDEAGQKATAKSIQTCLLGGAETEIIILPQGYKDVGDLVLKDYHLWQKIIETSTGVMEYFFNSVLAKHDLESAKGKKQAAQQLLNVIKDISDPIEQSFWLRKLSDAIGVDEELLTKVLEKAKLKKTDNSSTDQRQEKKLNNKPRKLILEERLLGLFSLFFQELSERISSFDRSLLSLPSARVLEKIINKDVKDIENQINQYVLAVKYYYDEKEGFLEKSIDPDLEWDLVVEQLRKEKQRSLIRKISADIKKAEQDGDEEALELLMREFEKLSKEENLQE